MQTIFSAKQVIRSGLAQLLEAKSKLGPNQRIYGARWFSSEGPETEEPSGKIEREDPHDKIDPGKVKSTHDFKRLLQGMELTKEQLVQIDKAVDSLGEQVDLVFKLKSEKESADEHLIETNKKIDELRKYLAEEKQESERITSRYKGQIEKEKVFAISGFAKDLLEIGDNLDRALQSAKQLEEKHDALFDGVKITKGSFNAVLSRYGVKKLEAMGEKFNPDLHEALFEVPMPDKEPGSVIHVQQDGYLIKERLLRAAKVGVSK